MLPGVSSEKLLNILVKVDEAFIDNAKPVDVLLEGALEFTESKIGYIAEVQTSDANIIKGNPEGKYLHCLSLISSEKDVNVGSVGIMFKNPNSVFGLKNIETIYTDDFSKYVRDKLGRAPLWPKNHPHITSFVMLPLIHQGLMIGQIGLANRSSSYSDIMSSMEIIRSKAISVLLQWKLQKNYDNMIVENSIKQSKNIVLANISHEVRTPLNTILGMNALLLETELDDNQYECLLVERTSCYHLLGLITDILDINKLEAGKMVFKLAPVNIQELVDTSYDLIGFDVKNKNLRLDQIIDSSVPKDIVGDKQRLKQMLGNLLSNAVKFTQNGSITTRIELASMKDLRDHELKPITSFSIKNQTSQIIMYDENLVGDPVYIKFSIRDTGIGIKQEDMRRLFKSYEQLDSSSTKSNKGTGLGLAITSELCTLMGGKIFVTSEYGVGSVFSFILPVMTYRQPRKELDLSILEGKVFLVVDDNEKNLMRLTNLLDNWGVEYREFSSAKRALNYVNNPKHKFDLGLLDIIMPVMDGNVLAERISRTAKPFPLIALSSDDGEHAVSNFFVSQIAKPYNDQSLLETIINVLILAEKKISYEDKSSDSSDDKKYRRHHISVSDSSDEDEELFTPTMVNVKRTSPKKSKRKSPELVALAHRKISEALESESISAHRKVNIMGTPELLAIVKEDAPANARKTNAVAQTPISSAKTILAKTSFKPASNAILKINQRRRAQMDNFYERAENTNINVLVVEDQEFNSIMIVKMLNNIGYTNIDTAISGEDAIRMVQLNRGIPLKKNEKSQYDLVLMDIIMPGKYNGVDASKKITQLFKRLEDRPKIVAVTASVFDGAVDDYITEGQMDGYIAKPIDKIQRITEVLRGLGFA